MNKYPVHCVWCLHLVEYLETPVHETANKVVTCYINLTLRHSNLHVLGQIALFYY